jgi:cell division septation protein DedD
MRCAARNNGVVLLLLSILLLPLANTAAAQPGKWEVRRDKGRKCYVERARKKSLGTLVAGPFKSKKKAEDELERLQKGPKCKK